MAHTNKMSTITILLSLSLAAARAIQCAFGITILLGSLEMPPSRALIISLAILHIFGAWLAFATTTSGVNCVKVDLLILFVTLIGAMISDGLGESGLAKLDARYSVAAAGIPMMVLLLLHRVLRCRRQWAARDDVEGHELEEV